jgi:hypothetical protein
MLKNTPLALAALALATTGCLAQERQINSYNEDVTFLESVESLGNVIADGARIQGDIGALQNFNEAAVVNGNDDGSWASLEVIAESQRGAAMHWLDIQGGLNHPALQPGARMTFRSGEYSNDPNGLHIDAMACQGPTAYSWDYDEPAQQVDVVVTETEDPNAVKIDYTTQVPPSGFTSGDRVSTGSFVLFR